MKKGQRSCGVAAAYFNFPSFAVFAITINELSALPNREGMLSMLLSVLQAPVSQFARAVNAVAEQKGEGAPAEAAAPAEETKPAEEAAA